VRLPLRDKFLWDGERVGEERVDLFRDLVRAWSTSERPAAFKDFAGLALTVVVLVRGPITSPVSDR
jgi:hypothetical protein